MLKYVLENIESTISNCWEVHINKLNELMDMVDITKFHIITFNIL
jgi:hypothetical protein